MKPIIILISSLLVLWGCGTANEPTYELRVSVSPTQGGSVSPSEGTFDKNEEVALIATPSNGWQFVRWEGDWSGTTNPTTVRMTRDYTIIGVFDRKNYALTVTVEGQGAVTERVVTTKSAEFPFETIVELTPIAAQGWVFKEWGGDLSGSQIPARVTVTGPKTVVAKFERRNYALTVTVEGQGSVAEKVVMAKSTDYPFETIVELTPVAAEGWVFKEWSGDLTGSQSPARITVTGPKTVVAKFERRNYALTVTVEGQGIVTEKVVMPKSADYGFETIVELTPIAAEGWIFKEWGGDLTGSQSPARITITGAKNVIAKFERKNYALTVTVQGQGSVTETVIPQKSTDYPFQTVVQLTPVPAEGWRFVEWTGDLTGSDAPKSITVDKPKSVTAKFERRNYALTVTVEGQGAVTERVVLAKSTDYAFETIVELTPIASEGWVFKEWGGDLSGSQIPARVTVTGPKSVVAKFERKNYALTVTVEGQGSVAEKVVMAKSTDYPFETIVELTPIASEGWVFKEWSGDLSGSLSPARITITGPKTVVAKFERRNYALTVTVEGQGSVTEKVVLAKSTEFPFETIVELTPVPAQGWAFKEWSGDLTGSQSPARVTVTGPKSVVARFMTSPTVTTGTISNLSTSGATIAGNITSDGGNAVTARGICYATTQNPTTSGTCVSAGTGTGTFSSSVTGLSQGTVYYVRAYATNSIGTSYSSQVSFTTWTTPTVTTGTISSVTSTGATVAGNVSASGGATVTARGICYSISENPTTSGTCVASGSGLGAFSATIAGRSPGMTYYVRAYATNSVGTSYGSQSSFTTLTLPSVTTGTISNITSTGATVAGNVSASGGATVTSRGICYSTSENPTAAGTCVASGSGTGVFSATIAGLPPGTTYYTRAYAVNSVGTSYGALASFATLTTPPSVNTGSVSSITDFGAIISGTVMADGGLTVTARGICYSTSQNPTTSGTCVASGTGTGAFSANLTGLSPETTYFARAYATNSDGTSYGSQVSFTTYFDAVTDIDGNIYPAVQIGTQLWMASNLKTTRYRDGSTIPNVTNASTWPGLTSGAWVYNDNNPANDAIYGKLYNWYAVADNRNLCPSGWYVPSDAEWLVLQTFLGTDAGYKMKSTSGWSLSGNGSNASGFNGLPGGFRYGVGPFNSVGSYGFFWSSTQDYAVSAWNRSLYSDGRDLGRGNDSKVHGFSVRCIKSSSVQPTVITGAVSNITSSSVTVAGNVTASGGSTVTARGICYSTTQNPTRSGTCVASGSGTGAFTANLAGLSPETTYFVRAYATNIVGTSYGSQSSFTTITPTSPTVTTGSVSSITITGVSITGNVTTDGGATVTTRGICYATTQNPSTSNTCVTSGSGTGSFSLSISGLTSGTTYYARAYATNTVGTSYGSQISFSTTSSASTSVTDIDGNVYSTIQIGNQVWLSSNLKTTRYRDGTSIPNVTDDTTWNGLTSGAWAHYDNNTANETVYGKLYNWYAVANARNVCPTGWHVPSDAEWSVLSTFLGTDVGYKMKSTSGWSLSGNGSNASGFNGLPGGFRDYAGTFFSVSSVVFFWSSTQYSPAHAWNRSLVYLNSDLGWSAYNRRHGFSVRCLRD